MTEPKPGAIRPPARSVLAHRGAVLVPVNGRLIAHTREEWERFLKGVDRDAAQQMSKPITSEEDKHDAQDR